MFTFETVGGLQSVSIPSDQVDSGTVVYVRLRLLVSDSLEYDAGAGFFWSYDSTSPTMLPRRLADRDGRRPMSPASVEGLAIGIVPNPARGSATVTLRTDGAREPRLAVVDALGRTVRSWPPIHLSRAGDHEVPIDLAGIVPGLYLIVADDGRGSASTPLSIAP